jgi:hypothetical protein
MRLLDKLYQWYGTMQSQFQFLGEVRRGRA